MTNVKTLEEITSLKKTIGFMEEANKKTIALFKKVNPPVFSAERKAFNEILTEQSLALVSATMRMDILEIRLKNEERQNVSA